MLTVMMKLVRYFIKNNDFLFGDIPQPKDVRSILFPVSTRHCAVK